MKIRYACDECTAIKEEIEMATEIKDGGSTWYICNECEREAELLNVK